MKRLFHTNTNSLIFVSVLHYTIGSILLVALCFCTSAQTVQGTFGESVTWSTDGALGVGWTGEGSIPSFKVALNASGDAEKGNASGSFQPFSYSANLSSIDPGAPIGNASRTETGEAALRISLDWDESTMTFSLTCSYGAHWTDTLPNCCAPSIPPPYSFSGDMENTFTFTGVYRIENELMVFLLDGLTTVSLNYPYDGTQTVTLSGTLTFPAVDLKAETFALASQGGVIFSYFVDGILSSDANGALYWATGPHFSDRIPYIPPAALFTIPANAKGDSSVLFFGDSQLNPPPSNATYLILMLDPDNLLPEPNKSNNEKSILLASGVDLVAESVAWNPAGGVDFQYFASGILWTPATIGFYWSAGPTFAERIFDTPAAIYTIPAFTLGDSGVLHLDGFDPFTAPSKTAYLVMDIDPGGNINETEKNNNGASVRFVAPVQITGITVNQGVNATSIDGSGVPDVVLNRPTVVRVGVSFAPGVLANDKFTIKLRYGDDTGNSVDLGDPVTTSVGDTQAKGNLVDVAPITLGYSGVVVAANPDFNSPSFRQLVNVLPPRPIQLAYFSLNYLNTPPVTQVETLRQNGEDFLKGAFPIDPSELTSADMGVYWPTEALSDLAHPIGAANLARELYVAAKRSGAIHSDLDRVIAVASHEWFTTIFPGNPTGGTFAGAVSHIIFPNLKNVCFVQEDDFHAVAHELGHSYGLDTAQEEYVLCPYPWPNALCPRDPPFGCISSDSGYWVQRQQDVPITVSYMGGGLCAYGPLSPAPWAPPYWTSDANYNALFATFAGLPPVDPEVLLVTGSIDQNGMGSINSLYDMPTGTPDSGNPGDAAVQVLDAAGNVLNSVPFTVDFRILDADPATTLGAAPFAFTIAYPTNAVAIQIVQTIPGETNVVASGINTYTTVNPTANVLAQVYIGSQLLRVAVQSIPFNAFSQNADNCVKQLLQQCDLIETDLAKGNNAAAINKMQNNIRVHLDQWLIENYPTDSPLQYTKAQILALVDEQVARLAN